MSYFKIIIKASDKTTEVVGFVVSWLIVLMVFVTIWDVLLRYIFNAGSVAIQNLEWYLFGTNFLLAMAMNFKNDTNARIDIFYNKFSPKTKAFVELAGHIVFLLPFCISVVWWAYPFVVNSWAVREVSLDPGGLPCIYAVKAMIPLGFTLLVVGSLPKAIKSVEVLLNIEIKD